jgi:signal transduction histidine kinase
LGDTFEAHRRALLLERVRWASGVAAVLTPFSVLASVLREQTAGQVLQRVGLSVAFALIFASTRYGRSKSGRWQSFAMTLVGAGGATALTLGQGHPNLIHPGSLIFIVMACGLLFPWTLLEMAGTCVALLVLFVTPALAWGPPPEFAAILFLFLCTAIISTIASHLSVGLRRRELEARERLLALNRQQTEFFANVNHEIRTPLTLTLAPLELMAESRDRLDPDARRHLDRALHNARALAELIDGVLELSRLEEGKVPLQRSAVSLEQLLPPLCQRFEGVFERLGITFALDVAPGLPAVRGDPAKLEGIVSNLLSNAVKFTPRHGRIQVSARATDGDIELLVEDDGMGIPEADRERVFERFTRLPVGVSTGAGIGLAVVKQWVELHGGSVAAEGVSPHGTRIRVRLPAALPGETLGPPAESAVRAVARADAWRPEVAPPLTPGPPEAAARVLIIEDHDELRGFLADYLGRDCQVAQAGTAEEGLALAAAFHPDVVLCDVRLPGDSGLAVARSLQQTRPAQGEGAPPSVILVTAYQDPAARMEGLTSGAIDFVSKPFHPAELAARVAVQVRLRQMTAEVTKAQKLAMLRTLFEGLSHEVRSPLTTIRYGAELLQRWLKERPVPAGEESLQVAGMIDESAERISEIIRSLSVLSQSEGRLRRERWDPARSVDSTLRVLGHRCGGIEIRQEVPANLVVQGDPALLDQVVMNLLDNAIRAMPSGGDLRVGATQAGGEVRLSVEDSGRGIEPRFVHRIFDPFFTTRPVGEGMGLGLHVSKQIVETHGGRIEVSSQAGQGTCFTVALPSP